LRRRRRRDRHLRAAVVEALENRLLFNRVHGVDVSQFQGTMNWDAAWNQNVRFAYVRASRTALGEDTLLDTNAPTAKTRGILTGAYHHAAPIFNGNFTDPIVDAQTFLDSAIQYMQPGYMRPMLDVEEDFDLNANGYNIRTWTAAFVNHIYQAIGVKPVLYTLGGYAESVFDASTVALLPDVWPAIHFASTDPVTTSSQPMYQGQIGTGVWRTSTPTPEQSWAFWQYSGDGNGKGALYGSASNPAIDLNVFNGDSVDVLKERFVIGSAKIPTLAWPADGASGMPYNGIVLDWNDSVSALRYDVYLDNMSTPAATNLTQSQWTAPMLAGGAHSWRVVAKGVIADDDTHVTSVTRTFTSIAPPLPAAPTGASPSNVVVNAHPVVLDWEDATDAVSYDVYLGTSPTPTYTNLSVSQSPAITPADGTRLWRVVSRNPSGMTSSAQFSYTMDKTAPTATPGGNGAPNFGTPQHLASNFTFNVTYTDATTSIDVLTLGGDDVVVTGPNGFSATAAFLSVDNETNGTPRTATYRINAPTGTWSRFDNGTYTVSQASDAVRDTAGNARAAATIGMFTVSAPFAWNIGNDLHVEPGPEGTPIGLSFGANNAMQAAEGATTLNFGPILIVIFHGTAGDDTIQWKGTPSNTFMLFDGGGGGNDEFHVKSGSMPLNTDYSFTSPNLALTIDAGAAASISIRQRLRGLNVNGALALNFAGRDYAVLTRSLAIGPNGRLDMKDRDLIVDPSAGDPPVSAAAIQAIVATAHNGGAWDGLGITTSMPDALTGLTTLGVAPAAAVLDFAPGAGATALFSGQSVTAAAVLVKYTYSGDANLDGLISGDDYSSIDFNVGTGASGYFNGDFNFDGIISGDDYSTIDFNITAQGAPL
jgi:GH25 family lysozyme M1 (1,4-beta-N-acetylmuramidase)